VGIARSTPELRALEMEGGQVGLLVSIIGLRGEVYPVSDLAALPTSTAPMPSPSVNIQCTLSGLSFVGYVSCPGIFSAARSPQSAPISSEKAAIRAVMAS
jgi:hypothetical protein